MGAPALGLQLIDFGRSLDLELLPPGTLLQVRGCRVGRWGGRVCSVGGDLQLIDFGRSLDLELLPPGTLLQVRV